jgi:zinc/manganese transport system substrate-binding protein
LLFNIPLVVDIRREHTQSLYTEIFMTSQSKFQSFILMFLLLCAALFVPSAAEAKKLKVITTLTDLASLTQEVGGDKVDVEALAKGYQDPHFVEPKPSFLLKLRNADLLILVGLDLEIGWMPPLITQSGNGKIQPAGQGYLDASQFAEILEIPQGKVTRAEGDVHPLGNPHYWLDPNNGRRIARGIATKLAEMDPTDSAYFQQRYQDFEKRLTEADKKWEAQMAPYRGRKIVTYHRSWPNFAKHFGLDVIGYIEPRPGIPPTPSHTVELVNLMKRENVKIELIEPYFDLKTPDSIASMVGGKVVVMMPSVGGKPEITDYFKLFDYDINVLIQAFQQVK